MTQLVSSIVFGFLSLCFIWIICISICVSIRLLILHMQKDLPTEECPTEVEDTNKQPTILSTPVEPKKSVKRKRSKEQPAKVYFVMHQQEED